MTKYYWNQVLALAIAFVVPACAHSVEIVLRETAQPVGGVVRLGDIAQITDADAKQLQRLQNMPLMPSPAANTQPQVSVRQVQDWLSMMGEDLTKIAFKGASQVVLGTIQKPVESDGSTPKVENRSGRLTDADVTNALTRKYLVKKTLPARASLITPTRRKRLNQQLEQAIAGYIQKRSGEEGPWDVEVKASLGSLRQLDGRKSPLQVSGGLDPWIGSQRFAVSFDISSEDASKVVEIEVPTTVAQQVQVVVARQPIESGRIITAADVELQFIPQTNSFRKQTATKLESVVGLVSKRAVKLGDNIRLDSLQAPLLVRRGEAIEAVARGGGISVRTFVKSRNDGLAGDLIELETLETKERLYGRVVGRGKVEVFSGSR